MRVYLLAEIKAVISSDNTRKSVRLRYEYNGHLVRRTFCTVRHTGRLYKSIIYVKGDACLATKYPDARLVNS